MQVVEREKDVQDAREMLARVREARDAAGLLAERGEERMIHMQGMLKASDEALAEKRRTMGVLNMFYLHYIILNYLSLSYIILHYNTLCNIVI